MVYLFTELQRKRRWQGSSVHHNHGHCTQHVPTMSPCQEDPPKLAGEVWRERRLHEHGVPGRDQGQDEEWPDTCSSVIHRWTTYWGK